MGLIDGSRNWLEGLPRPGRRTDPRTAKERQWERDQAAFRRRLGEVCDEVIYPHVYGNPDREVGGVLLGRKGAVTNFPRVDSALEALRAEEERATLTFTQETWSAIHARLEEIAAANNGEELEIVGWYHSHPGFGIFLSDHDLFIQRNFFSDPMQVALVVDPLGDREGVFIWGGTEGQDIEPLYEESIAYQLPPDTEFGAPAPVDYSHRPQNLLAGDPDSAEAIAILIMFAIGLLIGIGLALLAGFTV